ncbi:MAG: (2Fe-2S)-binding protein [Ktedonobacteraceae bacterium]|nr:(2Fe-2S)-binding protein [Ktedonobacteraceae bacterium]
MRVSMTVNGKPDSVEIEPQVLLVDFIRETLRLTGTKVGCETGQCGTCTVQFNGRSVKSCLMLAIQADGGSVQTIEGVAQNGQLHVLQEGFWEMHGVQCGFCTPGMIMSLLDLLQHNANPDEDEIRSWLGGNLCRCTGYQSIVRAVQYVVEKTRETTLVEFVDAAGV